MATETTFSLPNFVGELFSLSHTQTPFLSMMGGLTGGREADAKEFTWQDYDLPAAAQPAVLEGADPTASARVRTERKNVVQIFQYGVDISYTKLAATGQLGTPSTAPAPILGTQPVQDEMSWQIQRQIERAARDVNYTFWNGVYAYPADNLTARKTRGIVAATGLTGGNAVDALGAALSKSLIDQLLTEMHDTGEAPFIQPVLWTTMPVAVKLSNLYSNNLALAPRDRTIGGVAYSELVTEIGALPVVIDRDVPANEIFVLEMSVIAPRFLPIPGKGHFFVEPLAKTGAAEKAQLYGEIGLEYGPVQWHGRLHNFT